jgi:hypothetical protein
LHTSPEPGHKAMSGAEIDMVMRDFTGRRAFSKAGAGGRGDVFKYREWVASLGAVPVGGEGQKAE